MRIKDDRLLSMARGGDRAAQACFATRWWTPVYRFALQPMWQRPVRGLGIVEPWTLTRRT